ncbi:hypothetical protein D0868_07994 [Hortaea werneckii]|uniref:Zn(2)-C6 fungal-type domain-containing protein n=1 Tax=Hortaea werneckii TaxID=91943 RepID=A0A3M6YH70_HORWE|nr:hypothetical protein D0868_07994 [Hortaea werneckii]
MAEAVQSGLRYQRHATPGRDTAAKDSASLQSTGMDIAMTDPKKELSVPVKLNTIPICDEAKPACSRCRRLHIACNGGGQRRFKFMDPAHKRLSNGSTVVGLITANPRRSDRSVVHMTPGNGMSLQLSAYLSTIKPSVNFRQNLAWNYGAFLEEIPQRLGKNKALDAAVAALVSAHSNVCCKRKATPQTLVRYSCALEALKSSLDCVHEASSSETLCAIMVLLICQNFLGVPAGQWTGHCEVEGIFNPAIHFTDDEWRRIVELDVSYESEAVEGKVLRHLASIPGLTQQVKKLPAERHVVVVEARTHLAAIEVLMKMTRDKLRRAEAEEECPRGLVASMIHAAAMRAYGFCLAGALIMHHIIRCLDSNNATSVLESGVLVDESLQLAAKAKTYTPFASAHMHFVLAAAYMNAVTDDQRQAIQIAISAYQIDCSGDSWTSLHSPGLQWLDDLRYGFDMLVA